MFVSDGAKSDSGNIVDIFAQDNIIAVTDPVYPVYVDSNAMAGKTGEYLKDKECWSKVIYMPCTAENNFVPEIPEQTPDIIYICCPNNPTGTTLTKEELQKWVDYANEKKAVVGNPLENAIWEEFGTGQYALNGDGRKTPWYVPVDGYSGKKKPTYQGKVVVVYGKDGKRFYKTDGKKPQRNLQKAFDSLKNKLQKDLESRMKGIG